MGKEKTDIEEARAGMHGRILRCPAGENPKDCPLHEVRKWPIEERLVWLDAKTDEDVLEMYNYHINCLERKLEEKQDQSTDRSSAQ
jgi:hypothetical protein